MFIMAKLIGFNIFLIALASTLTLEALSIFSKNNFLKVNFSWEQSSCLIHNCFALVISYPETRSKYFPVISLILKTTKSVLLHNYQTLLQLFMSSVISVTRLIQISNITSPAGL